MTPQRAAIVLAAGKGKRMNSDLAKVLHPLAGKPIIEHVVDTLQAIGLQKIVIVIGHQGDDVQAHLTKRYPGAGLQFCWQREQKGTGHAVMMAREELTGFDGSILVTAGDVPYVSGQALTDLFSIHNSHAAATTCLSADFPDPTGYGRIVRDGASNRLLKIVEHKDATPDVRARHEINSGIFVFNARDLFSALDEVKNENAQGEYYLTDVIGILQNRGRPCFVSKAANPDEVRGINSLDQLQELERIFS